MNQLLGENAKTEAEVQGFYKASYVFTCENIVYIQGESSITQWGEIKSRLVCIRQTKATSPVSMYKEINLQINYKKNRKLLIWCLYFCPKSVLMHQIRSTIIQFRFQPCKNSHKKRTFFRTFISILVRSFPVLISYDWSRGYVVSTIIGPAQTLQMTTPRNYAAPIHVITLIGCYNIRELYSLRYRRLTLVHTGGKQICPFLENEDPLPKMSIFSLKTANYSAIWEKKCSFREKKSSFSRKGQIFSRDFLQCS